MRQWWLIGLTLCLGLSSCSLSTTRPRRTTNLNPAANYYLLGESPPRVVELNRQDKRQQRVFILAGLGADTPEGMSYVPNTDVEQYGLFGLPPSAHGGYFLIVVQRSATLHVFELPLLEPDSGRAQSLRALSIPNLMEDAAGVHYAAGEIWVIASTDQLLYRLGTAATKGNEVAVTAVYDLRRLPDEAADVEGITFSDPNTIFLAEDTSQTVTRYDNFPACLDDASCQPTWSRFYGALEPSGAVWHPLGRELLIVDDEGSLMRFNPETGEAELIFFTSLDLEGITLVPPQP